MALLQTLNDIGNPFKEDTSEFRTLDSHCVMYESVVNTVRTIEGLGKDQHNNYHELLTVEKHTIHP